MAFKNRLWIGVVVLALTALAMSACTPAAPTAAVEAVPTTPAASPEPTVALPTPEATTPAAQDYTNQDFGFTLRYPAGYEMVTNYYHAFTFMAPPGTPGHRERAFLNVELTGGQTAAWFAEQVKAENAGFNGVNITTMEYTIDGQPAVVLGGVPGMDLNRQVFVVHKGLLYRLTFVPADPQSGADFEQMVALYNEIMDSLRFLPDRREVPPVTSVYNLSYQIEQALEARSIDDVTRPLGDAFTVVYWDPTTPEGALYQTYGRNEAVPFILDNLVSGSPDLTVDNVPDWLTMTGSAMPFSANFPGENIRQVLVRGWGPQGDGEAALIFSMWPDGSLFWRGVVIPATSFSQ